MIGKSATIVASLVDFVYKIVLEPKCGPFGPSHFFKVFEALQQAKTAYDDIRQQSKEGGFGREKPRQREILTIKPQPQFWAPKAPTHY